MRVLIESLFHNTPAQDSTVTLEGWIRKSRDSKAFAFIELNDGSFFRNVQIVCDGSLPNFAEVVKYTLGSAIRVTGTVVLTPEMKQPFEIHATEVSLLGPCSPDYPIQNKRHTFEYLRTQAHLRPRTNTFSAVFRIRSLAAQAIHAFFAQRGFVYVHTPIITTSDTEGAGEMFRVTTLDLNKLPHLPNGQVDDGRDFFGRQANLTVSGQLNVEAYCMAFGSVYTFGPTFRAENSNTPRHAAEFWMIEPEIAFADLSDDMQLAEDMLKYVIRYVIDHAQEEYAFLNQFVDKGLLDRLEKVAASTFQRCSYTDAIDILTKNNDNFEYKVHWGMDIQTEHERYLAEKHFGGPVCVYNYPKDIKAFYMRMNDDEKTVAAVDILVPGIGELIGGSQREERMDTLDARMIELGMTMETYEWYL
ncbi:MAG: asparagine--tRNA ligase, partial [Clostridia bacterium]|nr:asparagine--tRNA ligase [Clostridia bacterium]